VARPDFKQSFRPEFYGERHWVIWRSQFDMLRSGKTGLFDDFQPDGMLPLSFPFCLRGLHLSLPVAKTSEHHPELRLFLEVVLP
jgi:hypothetical protein